LTKVFDASVVVKVLTEEAQSDLATSVMAAESDRIAPDILPLEVASALSKKVRYAGLPRDRIDRALHALPDLLVEQVPLASLLDKAITFSIDLSHPLYDCLYLALAEQRDCVLVTADEKFAKVVSASRVAHRVELLSAYSL
jgi:predicted nucleic acid-binding protein